MADTFTPSLRIQLMQTGSDSATWGNIANTQFQSFESAITGDNGYAGGAGGINLSGLTTYTLTVGQGTPDQARELLYPFIGSPAGPCTVSIPGVVKIGWALNITNQPVTLAVGVGKTITLQPDGSWTFFYCDGTNVIAPTISLQGGVESLTVNGAFTVNSNAAVAGFLTASSLTVPGIGSVGGITFSGGNMSGLGVFATNGGTLGGVTLGGGAVEAVNVVSSVATLGGVGFSANNIVIPGTEFSSVVSTGNVIAIAGTIGGTSLNSNNCTVPGFFSAASIGGTTGTIGGVSFASNNCNVPNLLGATTVTASTVNAGTLSATSVLGTGGTIGGIILAGNTCTIPGGLTVEGGYGTLSGSGCYIVPTGVQSTQIGWSFSIGLNVFQGVEAAGFLTNSDERMKTDIEDISADDAISWIRRGRPRTYLMDNRPSAGFVAQEDISSGRWQAVIATPSDDPMFADGDGIAPPGHKLTRNYEHDIAYLTAALQSALTRIETLETRLAVP